ncbi:RNA 3'-terminal phosphate cyclase, partial [Salinibacter sp.]|uniref:RNA 3'-terminal phosphate cyclase n=1 Tax=Salinibacter sp. TaxID=2065818 RepID=UPI0035D49FBC
MRKVPLHRYTRTDGTGTLGSIRDFCIDPEASLQAFAVWIKSKRLLSVDRDDQFFMIELDGSQGGGGLVRSALTLAVLTGEPFRIEDIRGARSNPGLRPQHLAAVQA